MATNYNREYEGVFVRTEDGSEFNVKPNDKDFIRSLSQNINNRTAVHFSGFDNDSGCLKLLFLMDHNNQDCWGIMMDAVKKTLLELGMSDTLDFANAGQYYKDWECWEHKF